MRYVECPVNVNRDQMFLSTISSNREPYSEGICVSPSDVMVVRERTYDLSFEPNQTAAVLTLGSALEFILTAWAMKDINRPIS